MFKPSTIPLVAFLFLLLIPMLQAVTHVLPERDLGENRRLADFPAVSLLSGPNALRPEQYVDRLSHWHSDRFPTRDLWVRLWTQYLFSLFGDSDLVYVGRDGYLFYHSVLDVEIPLVERMTDAEVADFAAQFGRLSQAMEARGVHLIVAPMRLKEEYYPEMLPSSAAQARHFNRFAAILRAMAATPGLDVLDARPILHQAKADGLQVFHRTDFHWTDPAGALVERELLRRIGVREGKPNVAQETSYTISPLRSSGGQARFLPLFVAPHEITVQLEVHQPDRPETHIPSTLYESVTSTNWPPQQLLPPIVLYGDSFTDAFERVRFGQNFQTYARARIYQQTMTQAFNNRPAGTKYFVVEFIEVSFPAVGLEVNTLLDQLESAPGG